MSCFSPVSCTEGKLFQKSLLQRLANILLNIQNYDDYSYWFQQNLFPVMVHHHVFACFPFLESLAFSCLSVCLFSLLLLYIYPGFPSSLRQIASDPLFILSEAGLSDNSPSGLQVIYLPASPPTRSASLHRYHPPTLPAAQLPLASF